MLYRDFMQKYRPLYSPDDGSGAAAPADGASAAAAGSAAASSTDAASAATPAAATAASSATPAPDNAGAAAAVPDSTPTLLEAASAKKPDAKVEGDGAAAAADAPATDKKDDPAPAADAKTDKDAKTDGDKKPEGDAAKKEGAEADTGKKDATAEAQPPAPIKYEAFKIPDGVKLDDKEMAKFTEIVGNAQVPQDVAQKLVDLYLEDQPKLVEALRAEQRKHWNTLNDTWMTETRNDPEIGGNRIDTSLSMAKAVVEEYLPPNEVGEYLAHLRNNGMGNFRLHIKLMANIGKALNVFEDGIVPANPQAPKAQKGPGNRGWYDKSQNAGTN